MPTAAFLSFRLGFTAAQDGLTDGVSIVAQRWADAFRELGWQVRTVAGEGPVDTVVPGLAIGASGPPTAAELHDALVGVDLVVVENLLTIPMNLPASRAVAGVLAGRAALLHHHDPAWQRERYRHVTELPPDDPAWRHVAINRLTAAQLAERGIDAEVIYNGFDPHPAPGDRMGTRHGLGVAEGELLAVHPVRAIARKDVPAALAVAEALGATYWLTGRAEEGYAPTLERVLGRARTRVIHRGWPSLDDIYAAADLVVFPSTWEGFGNPPVEAALRRKPAVVGPYPVADELRELGFRWFAPDDTAAVAAFLADPDERLLEANRAVAVAHLSTDATRAALGDLLERAGW